MNIKTESLRIGNLMREHYTDKIISVIELKEKSITFSDYFIGKWQSEPIEISEEILLKVGFEKNGRDYELCSQNGIVVEIRFVSDCYYLVTQEEWGYNGLLYLHQLQNLYFALTGQELNTTGLI